MPCEQNEILERLATTWREEADVAEKILECCRKEPKPTSPSERFPGALKELRTKLNQLSKISQTLTKELQIEVSRLPECLQSSFKSKANSVRLASQAVEATVCDLEEEKKALLDQIAELNINQRMLSAYEQH